MNLDVKGHLAQLSDDRLVFVGRSPAHGSEVYIAFRNSQGEDTKLVLSVEAALTLFALLDKAPDNQEVSYPFRKEWVVVVGDHP